MAAATKVTDKQALLFWEEFRDGIRKNTPVEKETPEEKRKRIIDLEADPEKWKEYHFKKFFKYPSPAFHRRASRRLITNFLKKKHWKEVRKWFRGASKSTTLMMDILYLVYTGKLKNIILTSSTYDAAAAFLEKYRACIDSNPRLINDYGDQVMPGNWAVGDFMMRNGAKFLAIGARQSPRGNGNAEIRPDCIIVDDFDTDEECRNPDILQQKWDWYERALFFTVDTSEPYLIVWNGNVIAEDCCVLRASATADHEETINIRDENGNSSWPEKNSDEDITYQENSVSYESAQQELYNNPLRPGQVFKEMTYGQCPRLQDCEIILVYSDPSPSNKDMPSAKAKIQNSCKSVQLLGYKTGRFYLYKVFLDHTTNAKYIDWLFAAWSLVPAALICPVFVENNTLQDPFYEQVFLPLIHKKNAELGRFLPITPDTRKKPDKYARIEGTLEPLNRLGQLILNIEEKEDPHMKRLEAQFKSVKPSSKTMDGPDCSEGGVFILKQKVAIAAAGGIQMVPRKPNSKRF